MRQFKAWKEIVKVILLRCMPDSILFNLKKLHYPRAVRRFTEPDMIPLPYFVKKGDIVVDIGANVGWYTRVLSELVGASGIVYSIEPIPSTFRLLQYVVSKLNLANVRLFNCAVSDTDTRVNMEIPPYESGGENYYQARINKQAVDPGRRHYTVEAKAIDGLIGDDVGKVTFVKCDVEGHELQVVKGATRLVDSVKPAWLLEVSRNIGQPRVNEEKVVGYMEKHGYQAYWFDGQQFLKCGIGETCANYFFLTQIHVDSLKRYGLGFAS